MVILYFHTLFHTVVVVCGGCGFLVVVVYGGCGFLVVVVGGGCDGGCGFVVVVIVVVYGVVNINLSSSPARPHT